MPHRKAVYVESDAPTHHCWLDKAVDRNSVENGILNQRVLENVYRGYLDEHRQHSGLNFFQKAVKRAETFIRHEVHEVDPQDFPPLDAIIFRTADSQIGEAYIKQAYKSACLEGIRRSGASAKKWNRWKEIANIYLPVPLGLAAFFTGVVIGTDGIAWAAAAEFGPYLSIPPAIWFERKEHKLRYEIEYLEKTMMDEELEEKRTMMGQYNTAKDICSFWVPVTFDGTLTGLSYSRMIPTPAHYMTGIVAMPYFAHGLGAFAMTREYACEEKEAVLRRMMDTPVIVADSAAGAEEIIREITSSLYTTG